MDSSTVYKILKANYVDSAFHTHVSLIRPRGKYQFNRQTLEEFWKAYCDLIGNDDDPTVGIAEKAQNYLPVLADIDIKIRDDGDIVDGGLYTDEQLNSVITVYQSVLRKIVDGCTDQDLTCVVLEKKMYSQTKNDINYLKHGFHLHFPFCFLSKVDQEVHLIPRVQDILTKERKFETIGFENSGDVIDKACCKVPWLLYGSKKNESAEAYHVTKVFNQDMEQISLEKAFCHYELFDHRERLISIEGKVEQYLPRILSIVPYGRSTKETYGTLISPLKEKIKNKDRSKSASTHKKLTTDESLAIAKRLLPMLSDFRAEDRNEWMTIGWLLYNISGGDHEALDMWCDFSSRSLEQYDESECIYQWERMVKKDLTLGTLRYYASVDNPNEYQKYKDEQADHHIKESLSGSHNDIAKVLYAEYGDQFVCASIVNKVWFQFVNHIWEQIEDGVFLREKISGRIVKKYVDTIKDLYDKLGKSSDKAEEAMLQARIKQVQKMVSSLKSAPYKNNIMKESMEVFYDKRFREKLDTDGYTIAFKNGVYDLKLNIFRAGRPEDFISKALPINYVAYTENDEKVQNVHTFLEQIFPDKSVRRYFLDTSSEVFVGGNQEKIVQFWQGEGDNGKSIVQNFFDKMLGTLAIKFNTTVVTGKKPTSGSAYADLARAGGGVRLATLEEPDGDEMVNVGVLKHLTGNDTFYARDLFEKGKDGREITPMFKLIFICLTGQTPIAMSSGLSYSIENLTSGNHKIMSWNNKNGIIPANQKAFIDQGVRECYTITLLDGREITCTPNHRFLTTDNEWVEAQNLVLGVTDLKMSIQGVNGDDIFADSSYASCTTIKEKFRMASLMRVLGYMLSDGSGNRVLYMGHSIDSRSILEDITMLTGITPSIHMREGNVQQIAVPTKLTKELNKFISPTGRRVESPSILPSFFIDSECPTFVIREFLGGLFGGDGIVPSLFKNNFTMMQLVASKNSANIGSLIEMFTVISRVMNERFEIESHVHGPIEYDTDRYYVFLTISKNDSILKFAERIGVRYCCHKAYRLESITSWLRRRDFVIAQNQNTISRVRELMTEGKCQKIAYAQAISEVEYTDTQIMPFDRMRCHYLSMGNDYRQPSIDPRDFLNSTNLIQFCNQGNGKGNVHYSVHSDTNVLPTFQMRVIGRKIAVGTEVGGAHHVYDISVEEDYSNFVATGAVTHNCNKLPVLKYSDKATWNRVRVLPFESTFCRPNDPAPETYEEQLLQKRFPMDKKFGLKIPKMIEAFAWVLLEHRKKVKVRVEPEKVRAATEMYRKQNDVFRQFIEESIIEDAKKSIHLTELYAQFKEWFRDSLPGHTLPVKSLVEEYFVKLWGTPATGKKWHGYRVRTLQDDVESGDAIIMTDDDLVKYDNNTLPI